MSVKFFLSKAKLADGSLRTIEHDSVVSWEVAFEEIDPQELVNQEEKAVRTGVAVGKLWTVGRCATKDP